LAPLRSSKILFLCVLVLISFLESYVHACSPSRESLGMVPLTDANGEMILNEDGSPKFSNKDWSGVRADCSTYETRTYNTFYWMTRSIPMIMVPLAILHAGLKILLTVWSGLPASKFFLEIKLYPLRYFSSVFMSSYILSLISGWVLIGHRLDEQTSLVLLIGWLSFIIARIGTNKRKNAIQQSL